MSQFLRRQRKKGDIGLTIFSPTGIPIKVLPDLVYELVEVVLVRVKERCRFIHCRGRAGRR